MQNVPNNYSENNTYTYFYIFLNLAVLFSTHVPFRSRFGSKIVAFD